MNYDALFTAGTYATNTPGVKVFAGNVDDPFWIDLGATFDTFNLRAAVNGGVLSPSQDASPTNIASDTVSGYAVSAIAIEVPVAMLTSTGNVEAFNSPNATIGVLAPPPGPVLRFGVPRLPHRALARTARFREWAIL